MARKKPPPELTFQQHIADYLIREHKYGVLEQSDISDTEHCIAEEQIARIIREHDLNQLFVAFTATPAPATVSMFGTPLDSYTEAEAIAEGYIVDVAASIISFKTLYNLHCPIFRPALISPCSPACFSTSRCWIVTRCRRSRG